MPAIAPESADVAAPLHTRSGCALSHSGARGIRPYSLKRADRADGLVWIDVRRSPHKGE